MAEIINVGTQFGDDIDAKIRQLMDNDCKTIVLTDCSATPQEESETIYKVEILGIKVAE